MTVTKKDFSRADGDRARGRATSGLTEAPHAASVGPGGYAAESRESGGRVNREPTPAQRNVLKVMGYFSALHGRFPTVVEITKARGYTSMQGQRLLLLELEAKGLVIRPKHTREQWHLSRAGLALLEGGS